MSLLGLGTFAVFSSSSEEESVTMIVNVSRVFLLDLWLQEISFLEDPVLVLCDKLHCYCHLLPEKLHVILIEIVHPHAEHLW